MGAVSPKIGQNIHEVKVEAQRQTVNAPGHPFNPRACPLHQGTVSLKRWQ